MREPVDCQSLADSGMTKPTGPPMDAQPGQFVAYSYSLALKRQLATSAVEWQVYSTHERACNLRSRNAPPIALVAPAYGNGPFHIVVPETFFQNIAPGMAVLISPEWITLPAGVIDLRAARPWQPRLSLTPSSIPDNVPFWLCEIIAPSASPLLAQTRSNQSPLQRIAADGIASLQRGLQGGALHDMTAGVQKLAGLGPGLTPAGDDFLLGWLFGLFCGQDRLAALHLNFAAIAAIVVELALPRTTWLSGAWLQHAAQGEFGAPWHTLAASMATSPAAMQQAIQVIRQTGATSGEDALAGFWHAWTSLYEQ